MTKAPYTAAPITELADQDRKVAEIVAQPAPAREEYRPRYWQPSAAPLPTDFFLPGLA